MLIQKARWMAAFALFMIPVISGCSGGGTCSVAGTVTYKTKPVYGGMVILIGDKDQTAQGAIEFDGTYLVTNAPTGKVRIGVVSNKPQPPVSSSRSGGSGEQMAPPGPVGDPNKWFAIDEKYGDPNSSGKEMTLKGGSNKIDITLD